MKLVSVVALFSVLMLAVASVASGAANLKTFGEGSTVTALSSTSAMIENPTGASYGGVYVQGKSLNGKALSKVDFEFTSAGDVAGGAPRFSMPISAGGYAFIDAANCGGTSGQTTLVSTNNASCKVYYGSESFPNWDAFAAAHADYKIGSAIPFIIADGTAGTYLVSGIDLH